jgi:hypothetical protein
VNIGLFQQPAKQRKLIQRVYPSAVNTHNQPSFDLNETFEAMTHSKYESVRQVGNQWFLADERGAGADKRSCRRRGSVNCCGRHSIGSREVDDGFAVFAPLPRFTFPRCRHFRRPPHVLAAQFGAGAAFACARAN